MESFARDSRHAVRQLVRSPGFTLAAVVSLALGIGANSAIFSVVSALLLRPPPVANPDRLAAVFSTRSGDPLPEGPLSWPDYRDYRDRSDAFRSLAAYAAQPLAIEHAGVSELVVGELVSENYFETLGVVPALGRGFDPDADGAQPLVVLSHSTWQRRYGGDPEVLGRTLRLNGSPFSVVGVAPAGFNGLLRGLAPELWAPLQMHRTLRPGSQLEERRPRWLFAVGRLAAATSAQQADARLATLATALQAEHPDTNAGRGARVLPLRSVAILPALDRVLSATAAVLMGIVGLVLLIACANVANMLLARAAARRREIAVRLALGASGWRLARLLLTESGLLAALGGGAALLVAAASNAALAAIELPIPLRLDLGLRLDARVLGFTALAAALTTALAGLAPALQARRLDLVEALKADARGATQRRWLRDALVVGQLALSTALLAGAGLSLRSLANASSVDPGLDPRGVVTAQLHPELRGLDDAQARAYFDAVLERVAGLPGVERAAWVSHAPLSFEIWEERAAPEGDEGPDPDGWASVDAARAGPGLFETLRIPVLSGRGFTAGDVAGAPHVAVINQTLAQRFWPGRDPLGRRLLLGREREAWTVVGVVRDGRYRTLGEAPRSYLWRPLEQLAQGEAVSSSRTLLARVAGDTTPALAGLRRAARGVDEGVPVAGVGTLEQSMAVSLLLPRASAALLGSFGALGLLLAGLGSWGLIAYTTGLRTREIGVRLALGARGADVARLVVVQSLRLTGLGLLLGAALALAVGQALSAVLYGVSPADPPTLAGVALVLISVALLAAWGPARRATRVEPVTVLRAE